MPQNSKIDTFTPFSFHSGAKALRHGFNLCRAEREFLAKRKPKVMKSLQDLLGTEGPKNLDEVS